MLGIEYFLDLVQLGQIQIWVEWTGEVCQASKQIFNGEHWEVFCSFCFYYAGGGIILIGAHNGLSRRR